MEDKIEVMGKEGLKTFKKNVKFGDIIENHYASKDNPHRIGIFIRILDKSILCTDGKGDFWRPYLNEETKLEIIGSVLK